MADETTTETLLGGENQQQQQQSAQTTGIIADDLSFSQGWTDKLPEDMGEARSTFGKFKSLPDLAKSYHELSQRLGKDANTVRVPGKDAKPEDIAAYCKAIGAPVDAAGYLDIKPADIPEGIDFNPEQAKPFYDIAAKHRIPKAAMAEMVSAQVAFEKQRVEMIGAEMEKKRTDGIEGLKRDWGSEFGKNYERAKAAAKLAGLDIADSSKNPGLLDPAIVKALVTLSSKISDDTWRTAADSTNSPKMSAQDIMTNKDNPLFNDYQGLNGKERQLAAQAKVNSLLNAA